MARRDRAECRSSCATDSPDQTRAVGAAVAGRCIPGDVLLLAGDLGAGKTTFAQGFGAGLGMTEPVTSPTFTLVRQYPIGPVTVRCARSCMPTSTGWTPPRDRRPRAGELVEDGAVALVEWGDAAEPLLGADALDVALGP